MNKKKINRIIAKDGLIIVIFIIFGIILLWISDIVHDKYYYNQWLKLKIDHTIGGFNWHIYPFLYKTNTIFKYNDQILFSNGVLLKYFAMGLYPIYSFIRFVIWAIKTLSERQ